jgi:phosphoglucosamine mutase
MERPRYFGTDGIRDVANQGVLTPERVMALGRALARLAQRRAAGSPLLLARDPRRSSPLLAAAVAAGAAAEGCGVVDLGVLPTPALAALLPRLRGALGVMVSASHNPMPDNGLKVLSGDGAKLSSSDEAWLENEMERALAGHVATPTGAAVGSIDVDPRALESYLDHLATGFPGLRLDGTKIVVDCASGAQSPAAPELLARLGADVHAIHSAPNGLDINEDCGAVHPESLARTVVARGADLGMAFDGDGDRMIAVSNDGVVRDGDAVLYVCARHLRSRGALAGATVVGTVMSNFGLELALREEGVTLERTPVGDRHVAARLREGGFALGGEPSGHLVFGSRNGYIGDGLWSALELLAVLKAADRPFATLLEGLAVVPQVLLNVRVAQRRPLAELPAVEAQIAAATAALGGDGRLLVRYSGTENLLRVMVEGRDAALVEALAASIAAAARAALGAPESSGSPA